MNNLLTWFRSASMPLLALFMLFTPFAFVGAAVTVRNFSASTTPTSVAGGVTQAFAVNFMNSTTSTKDIKSGRVTLPSGFSLVTAPALNLPDWQICISGADVAFRKTHDGDPVAPGQAFSLTFSASTPVAGGGYAFGVYAFGDDSCEGDGSAFANQTPGANTVTVRSDQTITFGPLAGKTLGDADFAVSATSTSGLVPAFSSQTTLVCTVTGTSTVHLVSAGTCTIRASQAGDDTYNAAPDIDQSFTVAPGIPACLVGVSSFDGFSLGSVNGQGGWSSTGPFDQAIVNNTYGFPTFGCKSLRISDAVTSGTFGNQTFSDSVANEAGDADAVNGGFSGGTRQNHFEAQFDLATAKPTYQPGLDLSVSPDRGDGARMSYLRFEDAADGINVFFDDVQTTTNPASWTETQVGSGLSRTVPHTIKFAMDFVNGPSNDVVKIYIDGTLVHTGTSWENYFRFATESQGSPHDVTLENKSRTVDSLLFREGGTAGPANAGYGFLIDNYSLTSSTVPPTLENETIVVHPWNLDTTSSNPLDVIAAGLNKWFMYNDTNDTVDNTLGSFIVGPAPAPAGAGSVQFALGASPFDRKNIATYQFSGTVLTTITEMSYSAYSHSGVAGPTESPYFNFNVDFTGTSGSWQKRLVYVPSVNGVVPQDAWNTFDVINGGNALWTWSGYAANGNKWPDGNTSQYRTWNAIKTAFPGARVLPSGGWLGVRVGEPGPTGYVGNVDKFVIGIQSGTTIHTTTYDFEPDTTAPVLPVHLWPENGAIMPSSSLTHLDWTDVTDDSAPVTYYYESSHSSATTTGAHGSDFTSPAYQSSALAASQIASGGTPEGVWYWHVRAVDAAGNSTPWTAPWRVTVDNTPPDVTVTIAKYIGGTHATADNAGSASFPMHAVFPGGEGNYSLGPTGYNNLTPYEATTSNMPWGSDYSTYEITSASGPVYPVGVECPAGSFRLAGYKVGGTPAEAEAAASTTTAPAFDGLMMSKYVIVENEPCTLSTSQIIQPTDGEETSGSTELEAYYADENGDGNDGVQWAVRSGTCAAGVNTVFGNVDGKNTPFTWDSTNFHAWIDTTQVANGPYCFVFNPTEDSGNADQRLTRNFTINNAPPAQTVTVHIYKYLSDGETESLIPNDTPISYLFPMSATWSAANIGSGSGSYTLGNDYGHPSEGLNYTASTSVMSAPASYSTHEVTTAENPDSLVLPSDALCQPGMYKLLGYRTGETRAAAEVAPLSTTTPSFTDVTSDRHVIVVNKKCGDVPEVHTSTVTMCKVDAHENGLSGWRLILKGATVNEFTLMANSILGANTDSLTALDPYVATISGTWTNVGHNVADAEYTSTSTPAWANHMQGYPGLGEDEMDVQVGQQFVDWGEYRDDHTYTYAFVPSVGGPVNFRVFDGQDGTANPGWYGDNEGSLALDVAHGYAGITGEDGCVTFENVPYGSYTVSEVSKPGWVNDSGLGQVTVDAPTERFTVVNHQVLPPATLTLVKHATGGDDTFRFVITQGESVIASTTITTEGGAGTSTVELAAGSYDVTEQIPEDWQLAGVSCTYDGESVGESIHDGESITVGAGDAVTCTFTDLSTKADLSVTKTVNTAAPLSGAQVTYTITAANAGPGDAYGVTVTDVLPSGLTYVSDDGAGAYATSTGIWTIGTLLNGSSTVLHITATVRGETGTKIVNTAAVTAENTDPNTSNDTGAATTTVAAPETGPTSGGSTPPSGGGGNGPIVGSFGQVLGASTSRVGQVLGASTTTLPNLPNGCTALVVSYMRQGMQNDPAEVRKLQQFLNTYLHLSIPVTGFFGPMTDRGVRQFQMMHKDQILTPWGLTAPTGFVYRTTQRWINLVSCSTLNIPLPTNLAPYAGE